MKIHFDKVEDFVGFAVGNKKIGDTTARVLSSARLTSDDPNFHHYSEQISNIFLNKAQILINSVSQFLVIIHQDLSADLYVNDFPVAIEIRPKKDIKKGEVVRQGDIADVSKVIFPQVTIIDTDKIIYCFKVGWRFGLFFDLSPRVQPKESQYPVRAEKLDVDEAMRSIGDLYRYLSFYNVYKILESEIQFEEMKKDGWFPFVEIVAHEYKELSETYVNKFDHENRIRTIVDRFDKDRINRITDKWWKKNTFNENKNVIEAGIHAYLENTPSGIVNCIKNLWTEMEGILRRQYLVESGKGNNVKSNDLINFIIKKAKDKSKSDSSLLFPLPFLKYLKTVVYPSFNIENGKVEMSRHTSSHGVAKANEYTKERALQLILIMDQLYFYC